MAQTVLDGIITEGCRKKLNRGIVSNLGKEAEVGFIELLPAFGTIAITKGFSALRRDSFFIDNDASG
ncbi:MAG: hypothetical protein GTN76_03285 [Candidatus Aenigmarchaeota archaeon]|nr:hypothetical protein [Candidatus Aenigmarchaeota archaeon]